MDCRYRRVNATALVFIRNGIAEDIVRHSKQPAIWKSLVACEPRDTVIESHAVRSPDVPRPCLGREGDAFVGLPLCKEVVVFSTLGSIAATGTLAVSPTRYQLDA